MSERRLTIAVSACEQCHHYKPMELKRDGSRWVRDRCRLKQRSFSRDDDTANAIPEWCPLPFSGRGDE